MPDPPVPAHLNDITREIVDAAITVHRRLGPGLLESVYEGALGHELRKRGRRVATQVPTSIGYDGIALGTGFYADMVVDEAVLVELKAVARLHPVAFKQTLTYLKATGIRVALLLNFDEELMRNGIHRIVRRYDPNVDPPPPPPSTRRGTSSSESSEHSE